MFNGPRNRRLLAVILITLALALGVFVVPALASEVITDGEVVIDEDVADDVYAFGEKVTIDATIDGDLIAFGSSVIINGTVTGDVLCGGQVIVIEGSVGDDLRCGGTGVLLGQNASVGDDMNVGAMAVEMRPGSKVGGDLFFGALQAVVGDVAGHVAGGGQNIRLNGAIGGDVDLNVGESGGAPFNPLQFMQGVDASQFSTLPGGLSFGEGASVEGDLTYTTTEEVDIPSNAVSGKVSFVQEVSEEAQGRVGASGSNAVRRVGFFASTFLILLVLGLVVQRYAPTFLNGVIGTLRARALPSLGVGCLGYLVLAALLIVGLLLVILLGISLGTIGAGGPFVGVIGLFINAVATAFRLASWWLPPILIALPLGTAIYRQFDKNREAPFWSLAIGLLIVALVLAIPVAGGLLRFVLSLFGLGAIILYVWPRRSQVEMTGEMESRPLQGPEADQPAA